MKKLVLIGSAGILVACIFLVIPRNELHAAVRRGDLVEIKRLVEAEPEIINDGYINIFDSKRGGQTPLAMAIELRHHDEARALLELGADPDLATDMYERPPLIISAIACDLQGILILLESKADPNAVQDGLASLHLIAMKVCPNSVDMAKSLLEHGADPNLQDLDGKTPLFYAADQGRGDLVDTMIIHGGDMDIEDKNGESPRNVASKHHSLRHLLPEIED